MIAELEIEDVQPTTPDPLAEIVSIRITDENYVVMREDEVVCLFPTDKYSIIDADRYAVGYRAELKLQ